jgi:hypothetical protein
MPGHYGILVPFSSTSICLSFICICSLLYSSLINTGTLHPCTLELKLVSLQLHSGLQNSSEQLALLEVSVVFAKAKTITPTLVRNAWVTTIAENVLDVVEVQRRSGRPPKVVATSTTSRRTIQSSRAQVGPLRLQQASPISFWAISFISRRTLFMYVYNCRRIDIPFSWFYETIRHSSRILFLARNRRHSRVFSCSSPP